MVCTVALRREAVWRIELSEDTTVATPSTAELALLSIHNSKTSGNDAAYQQPKLARGFEPSITQ